MLLSSSVRPLLMNWPKLLLRTQRSFSNKRYLTVQQRLNSQLNSRAVCAYPPSQWSLLSAAAPAMQQVRSLHSSQPHHMKTIHLQNPLKWLKNWVAIQELNNSWDPNFNIEEFKRGAAQGLVTILKLSREREWGELVGLLDQKIIEDWQTKPPSSKDQIELLVLDLESIHHVALESLRMMEVVDQRYCDCVVLVVASRALEGDLNQHVDYVFKMKWYRNYTRGQIPSWTVTGLTFVHRSRPSS